jgi:hypothetical protein
MSYYSTWQEQLDKDTKANKKRWNGKVITTGRQWNYNANGSSEIAYCSTEQVYWAVQEYRQSKEW